MTEGCMLKIVLPFAFISCTSFLHSQQVRIVDHINSWLGSSSSRRIASCHGFEGPYPGKLPMRDWQTASIFCILLAQCNVWQSRPARCCSFSLHNSFPYIATPFLCRLCTCYPYVELASIESGDQHITLVMIAIAKQYSPFWLLYILINLSEIHQEALISSEVTSPS